MNDPDTGSDAAKRSFTQLDISKYIVEFAIGTRYLLEEANLPHAWVERVAGW
ncbi:MAG: hypothetical protein AB1584_09895 [Pseudomonadota bacterium]